MSNKIKAILGSIYLIILTTFLYLIFSEFDVDRINDFSYYKELRINIEQQLIGQNLYLNLIIFFTFSMIWVVLLGFGSPILILSGIIFGKWIGTFISLISISTGSLCLYIIGKFFVSEMAHLSRFRNTL